MKENQIQLSANELQTLATLETEAALLEKHQAKSRVPSFAEAVKAARNEYVQAPSDARLEKYMAALRAEAHVCIAPPTNGAQMATTIQLAKTFFIENKLKPFVAAIIDRALATARKNFEAVKKTESKKIEDATGHPYHDGIRSKPIDEARGIVTELESLSRSIAPTEKFFSAFREVFAAA